MAAGAKKQSGEPVGHPTPAKRLKPEKLVAKLQNMEDLRNTPLATIAMTTMKHVTWKLVLAGDLARPDVFMANPGGQDINFQQGSVLMAFEKIKKALLGPTRGHAAQRYPIQAHGLKHLRLP